MNKRPALILILAATLLSTTVLTLDIPFVSAIEWSAENPVTATPDQDLSPVIMQADDGTVWVVWARKRVGFLDYDLFYKTSSDYENWSPETQLTEDPRYDTSPSIMQASDGAIWVVWSSLDLASGNYDLFYKTSPNYGVWWSDDTPLTTDPNRDTSPSIMQADDGVIWVVWSSNRTGNHELFYKTFNGTVWSSDLNIPTDSSFNHHPSIVQASDGAIWVVWSGNHDLFYKIYSGSAWSSDTPLTDDPNFDEVPSIAKARDGTIWVTWQSDRPSGDQDELYYKIYDGSTWSLDTALTDNPADDRGPSAAQIDDKRIWVVWHTQINEDSDIYYKTSSEIIAYDIDDLTELAHAYGSTGGPPPSVNWDQSADINKDNIVNVLDLWLLGKEYG